MDVCARGDGSDDPSAARPRPLQAFSPFVWARGFGFGAATDGLGCGGARMGGIFYVLEADVDSGATGAAVSSLLPPFRRFLPPSPSLGRSRSL